jgi:HD-like signal output (HDOD) protein/CheY-like chemotaxis protein
VVRSAVVLLVGEGGEALGQAAQSLGHAGHTVRCVHGAEDAQQAVEAGHFDVIVAALDSSARSLEVLATAKAQRPSAARILFLRQGGAFGGLYSTGVAHQVIHSPFDHATIESVIDRAAGGYGAITDARLRSTIGATAALPALPATVLQLLRLLDDPSTGAPAVVRALNQDPAIAAKVLQLVNSAFFGLPRRIASVEQAVVHLGLNTIRNVVLASQAFQVVGAPEVVLHSVRQRGVLASHIARALGGAGSDEAQAGALLRDVGELLLAARLPRRYGDLLGRVGADMGARVAAEAGELGATHAQVGARLLTLWGLPPHICEAVAFHHTAFPNPAAGLDPTAVVFIAGAIADEACGLPDPIALDPDWIAAMGLGDRIADLRHTAANLAMCWPRA